MINKITISGVASYKNEATLETDKNINLIYGINGSGKSTFSEYLRKRTNAEYTECSIEPVINDDEEEISDEIIDMFDKTLEEKGLGDAYFERLERNIKEHEDAQKERELYIDEVLNEE